jgi:predicted nucleic acid-binding protein
MAVRDTIVAATAAARGWTVATRNSKDFALFGVKVFNPWMERI